MNNSTTVCTLSALSSKKLSNLSHRSPEYSGPCQLLHNVVTTYIDVHDEAPLPAIDAERLHRRMAELLATIDLGAPAEPRLVDFNRVASCDSMN